MKTGIVLLLLATAVFAGSQSSQAAGKREPKADLSSCVSAVQAAWDLTFKHEIASFMGVSQERMPALFCHRIAEGLRSGRISYSDINNLQLDQATEFWTVIKGKPKPAKVTQAPAPRSLKFRNCSGVDGAFQVPISQNCPLSGWANH